MCNPLWQRALEQAQADRRLVALAYGADLDGVATNLSRVTDLHPVEPAPASARRGDHLHPALSGVGKE